MARLVELRLLTRVARLYYEQGMSQERIAEQIGVSQAKVSRMLSKAKREGVVRVTVNVPRGVHADLEERIQLRYGLKEAIVADCLHDTEAEILNCIGNAAAYYLESTLGNHEVVGISSWSSTLLSVVDRLHQMTKIHGTHVVQILGGIGNPAAEVHASHMTKRLASLIHGTATFLTGPGVAPSPEARAVYMQDQFLRDGVAMFDRITLALVGIGALEPSRLLASSGNVFSRKELTDLKKRGAVGDLVLRFFDRHGKPVDSPLDDRVIGIDLERLRKVDRVVGIAGGASKTPAIRAALEGGWLDILITDIFTAKRMIS